ncbi:hypothetical protein AB0H88_26790 [Nonomuraea sp. NPDC050680]|uniref:hypothetical protein n=1 Tax=Nonomuraea sp. NPDC050680 TaxID=3154630 RepID=UPI0033FBE979
MDTSTQPIPAIPSAGPLPRPSVPPLPAVPPPAVQPPSPLEPAPFAGPVTAEVPVAAELPVVAEVPVAVTPPPRRRRPVLAALGAVAALVVALGAMTYDRYHVYLVRSGQIPAKQEQVVQAGQSVTVKHVSWKSTMETVPQIPGSKPQPGSAYVKIDISRSAVDADGQFKTAKPKELFVTDRQGRTWVALVGDDTTPAEKMEVGEPYQMTAYARVPAAQAAEVELLLTPSNYRSDVPTNQLMTAKTEPDLDVLRFKR